MKNRLEKILELDYHNEPFVILDLTRENNELLDVDLSNTHDFQEYIEFKKQETGSKLAIGRYGENRIIYNHSYLFQSEATRSVHLGLDFWVNAGMKVYSPFDARIHSFNDNSGMGNYGPTIILEHNKNGTAFYSLYGHLSERSIKNIKVGKKIKAGDFVGEVGHEKENGLWPPHLHFQLINSISTYKGDFPGVCKPSDKLKYFRICPNPNSLLKINNL